MNVAHKIGGVVFSAIVWTFAGALFGGFFAGFAHILLLFLETEWIALVLATALAATVTASFFGSMQVALLGSMIGMLTTLAYLMLFSDSVQPLALIGVAALFAVAAGLLLPVGTVVRTRPLGQALSGIFSGVIAGLALTALLKLTNLGTGGWLLSAVAVGLVGVLYLLLSRWIVVLCSDRISSVLGGPLVSGIIATAVAGSIWILVGTAAGISIHSSLDLNSVIAQVPSGVLGGAIGGALGGALLELMGIRVGNYSV